jgi:phage head maturation protease
MSTELEEREASRDERPVLVRAFGVHAELADKSTLDVRIVPFDQIGTVADPPDFRQYREQWMPGVFANQERAANRVLLRFKHDGIDAEGYRKPGLAGVVGHGLSLRETSDGYHGSFRLHGTHEAETARALLEDDTGPIRGVSAEFVPIRSVRTKDGIVQRFKAHLDSVSLAFNPVYSKAEILALREQEEIVDEEMLPPPPNRELLARCQKLGIALPERMLKELEERDKRDDESKAS